MAHDKPAATVSEEDLEAGAYFPKAKDWLDIGRRRLRYQLKRLEVRLRQFGKRLTYPLDTNEAWYVLRALGYKADRKSFDYCVRHARLETPAKEGNRLLWTVDSVIDFGMQLERMRYWQIGRHDHKKTVWELQAEWDQRAPAYDDDLSRQIDTLDADGLLDLMVETKKNGSAVRAHVAGYYHIRRWEQNRPLDETDEQLIQQLIEEEDASARKAVATTIRRRAEKEAAK